MPAFNVFIAPLLTVDDAAAAIEWYKSALDFEEHSRVPGKGTKILHCELRRGDYRLYVADEFTLGSSAPVPPTRLKGSSVLIHLGVPNVDAAFEKAVGAGAKVTVPLENQFWGDRYGRFVDPFGHHWSMSTHHEDVPLDELKRRASAILLQAAGQNEVRQGALTPVVE